MVQMKVEMARSRVYDALLYIPHGSDESADPAAVLSCQMAFISHMVQMKGYKACHRKTPTLHFISHMVQMKAQVSQVQVQVKWLSLYPTWFR